VVEELIDKTWTVYQRDTPDGRIELVYVSSGISGGEWWLTVYRALTGGTHRIKSKTLPLRDTRQEAQADLDAYAATKGWRIYGWMQPDGKIAPRHLYKREEARRVKAGEEGKE
jgi:hypothetical protein